MEDITSEEREVTELLTSQMVYRGVWLSWGTNYDPVTGTYTTVPLINTLSDHVYTTLMPGGCFSGTGWEFEVETDEEYNPIKKKHHNVN
eukprot:11014937-Ditylum_brightwellii.AAC.1